MPTLGQIANDVLNILKDIKDNTDAAAQSAGLIKGDTADIKKKLDTLQGTVQGGFGMTGKGLFAILEQQKATNSFLLADVEQNKTIICWLTNIADLLCRIMRKTNTEVELQTEVLEGLQFLGRIAELVHARETVEIRRLEAIESRVKSCCPPEEPPREPCYEPCTTPDVVIYHPEGGDWQGEEAVK